MPNSNSFVRMKKCLARMLLVLIMGFALGDLPAQVYNLSDDGSTIEFTIRNLGFNVTGSFKGLKGRASFDPGNPAAGAVTASVEAATISTGNNSRNSHLKKEEYFDVARFPLINFVSTKIARGEKAGELLMTGNLTIKGTTRVVSFPFTFIVKGEDIVFSGEFRLNRRDFGVGGNSLVLSDNLVVSLSALARKAR
jgi:polyisoprenoid-binding protein YceI